MPVSAGKFWSNWVNASNPPADAPTPMIGNPLFAVDEVTGLDFRVASVRSAGWFSTLDLGGTLSRALCLGASILRFGVVNHETTTEVLVSRFLRRAQWAACTSS